MSDDTLRAVLALAAIIAAALIAGTLDYVDAVLRTDAVEAVWPTTTLN